jgi:preprotein translocase subunit SecA
MLNILNKFFDSNEKEVDSLKPVIQRIQDLEDEFKKYKDKDFIKKTEEFRERIAGGEDITAILPEAFALVREAAIRTIGLRHFDVQLMAAAVLATGKIAEQKTGEGKTLSAVPALYLNSLTGKNVHLVTVNDYLARRDAGWMGPIFSLLGVSVSSIINDAQFLYDPEYSDENATDPRLSHLRPVTRKEAYDADVVYGINSEFGFDYLRDNMASSTSSQVQRGHFYAIVDEVDSVLIDEARTPHIISAPAEEPSQRYYEYATLVQKLSSEIDYKVDEKMRTAHLTEHGIGKVEKLYGVQNIYEKDFDTVYHLEAALKAMTLYHREKEYIVRDGEVILVDEFTGRLRPGVRVSEGIHQALEAKEGVQIQRESKTLATVSLQNYFRMYEKLAGMTGTALTEAEEFKKIYKLDVVVIPTNNPVSRLDHPDAVYKTSRAKYSAVANAIAEAHKSGQPVLVGTTSIEKNVIVSDLLKRRGIKHEILNAKNHIREAQIIAKAGEKGAVTVATNMAGRGVDIVLGGEQPKDSAKNSEELKKWKKAHDDVLSLGGLFVIGTERHESRRIDNQLRGRSGRQGDPGASRFYVGLDDEIMRLFGGDRIAGIMTRFNMPEDVPLEHSLVSRAIENAQVKVEQFNFDTRKHLVEYDDVLNKQREIIYSLRQKVLEGGEENVSEDKKNGKETHPVLKEELLKRIDRILESIVMMAATPDVSGTVGSENEQIAEQFATIVPFDEASTKQLVTQLEQNGGIEGKLEFITNLAHDMYDKLEGHVTAPIMRQIERVAMLETIDRLWMDHLDAIENVREGIRLRGYAQKDPLVEYKNEGFKMFEKLLGAIDDDVVHRIYKYQVQTAPPVIETPQNIVTNTPDSEVSDTGKKKQAVSPKKVHTHTHTHADGKVHTYSHEVDEAENTTGSAVSLPKNTAPNTEGFSGGKKKLGRNDPCWCGSGKKYKKCHYPN